MGKKAKQVAWSICIILALIVIFSSMTSCDSNNDPANILNPPAGDTGPIGPTGPTGPGCIDCLDEDSDNPVCGDDWPVSHVDDIVPLCHYSSNPNDCPQQMELICSHAEKHLLNHALDFIGYCPPCDDPCDPDDEGDDEDDDNCSAKVEV